MCRSWCRAGLVSLVLFWSAGAPRLARADLCPEPNNGLNSACLIGGDAVLQGAVDAPDDVDAYRFAIPEGGDRALLSLTNLVSDADLFVSDARGSILGSSEQEDTADEALELVLRASGSYVAFVRAAPDRQVRPGSPYTLGLTLIPLPGAEAPAEPAAAGGSSNASTVIFSDSFDREAPDRCDLGPANLAYGGTGAGFYLPIFPTGGRDATNPIGARIEGGTLLNNGLDFGGVQFARLPGSCSSLSQRGQNYGQDLNIRADLLVPGGPAGQSTQAGPYLRSRAAARGDGIIGGTSGGYWVQLWSSGELKVRGLNPWTVLASAAPRADFDASRFHRLEVAAGDNALQVMLDGELVAFTLGALPTTVVMLPSTGESIDGTAGLAFGAEANRGQAGGQRVDNLAVSRYHPLGQ
jgi:hypothetical protein